MVVYCCAHTGGNVCVKLPLRPERLQDYTHTQLQPPLVVLAARAVAILLLARRPRHAHMCVLAARAAVVLLYKKLWPHHTMGALAGPVVAAPF